MIKIGTLVNGGDAQAVIPQIIGYGFETFSLTFWDCPDEKGLKEKARVLKEILAEKDAAVSCLSFYGNPLLEDSKGEEARRSWEVLINSAGYFGADMVTGFTGRMVDVPVNESIARFGEVFGELGRRAQDKGVRLAFENCYMGGSWSRGGWNIAHGPVAWEMMFNAVPLDNIGLEWEPCHQLVNLIDPVRQLRKWAPRVFHVHGKDATVAWDIIDEYGINGPREFAWHRTPGFGDTNWADVVTILMQNGFKGAIDIEGYHDPVFCGELEMTGQVRSLNYLKDCRGGRAFIPNPQ